MSDYDLWYLISQVSYMALQHSHNLLTNTHINLTVKQVWQSIICTLYVTNLNMHSNKWDQLWLSFRSIPTIFWQRYVTKSHDSMICHQPSVKKQSVWLPKTWRFDCKRANLRNRKKMCWCLTTHWSTNNVLCFIWLALRPWPAIQTNIPMHASPRETHITQQCRPMSRSEGKQVT